MDNAKIGTALLGGYLLGRTKKAKLAVSLGALLAGSRIKPDQIGRTLQESPFLKDISKQVRTELTGAGKAAASSMLTAKADSLADALQARTSGLRQKSHGASDEETDTDEADVDTSEADETDADADEADVDEAEQADEDKAGEADEADEASGTQDEPKPKADKGGKSAGGRSTAGRSGSKKSGSKDSGSGSKGTKTTKKTSAAPSRSRSGTSSRPGRSDDG